MNASAARSSARGAATPQAGARGSSRPWYDRGAVRRSPLNGRTFGRQGDALRTVGATLKYLSGEPVVAGDVVRVTFQANTIEAHVVAVLIPGSAEALAWNAPEGGIMVDSNATGRVLWRRADEDMAFIRRTP